MIRSKRALEAMEEKFTQYPTRRSAPKGTPITPAEALELHLCSQSFEYFSKHYLKLHHPVQGPIPFEIKPHQLRVFSAWEKNSGTIVVAPRQSGMTAVPVAMLLWDAIFNPNRMNVAAFNGKTGDHTWVVLRDWVSNLPAWMNPGIRFMNKATIEFSNGSRLVNTHINRNACRGLSISNLFVDNLAFAATKDQEEFWYSVSPVVAYGGKVLLTGVPNGCTNTFSHIWHGAMQGLNGFAAVHIKGHEAHTMKHLQDMASILGVDRYMREYEGSFA